MKLHFFFKSLISNYHLSSHEEFELTCTISDIHDVTYPTEHFYVKLSNPDPILV